MLTLAPVKKRIFMTFKKGHEINLGRPCSLEKKEKLSKSHKGIEPWNKSKIGVYTDEALKKMSEARIGTINSEETNKKISKMRKKQKPPMLGKHRSKETKRKISEALRGALSCCWKGGITPLRKVIQTSFLYRQWRSDVFHRDDFTCQECNIKGGILNAHHKKSFTSIIQFYEITTLEEALECEELWNINNGITLCEKCHKDIHKINLQNNTMGRG